MDDTREEAPQAAAPFRSPEAEALLAEHQRWQHAMQTGVKMVLNYSLSEGDPKHLRVGMNTALVDHASLAQLLIAKGVFTDLEYLQAIRDGMRAEAERYEAEVSRVLGHRVTLG